MRHLENIWRGYELAWCTGFTTSVHGCPTSSEHYKSMMGKTIDSVTYYTDKGIITFDVNDEKVLTKTGVKASVANIHTTDTEAAVTLMVHFQKILQQNMLLTEQKLPMQTARSQLEH